MSLRLALCLAAGLAVSPVAAMEPGRPFLDTLDNATLQALQARGFGFGRAFGEAGSAGNAALHAASPAYRRMAGTVAADVRELRADMASTGRPLFEVTNANQGRVFELAWLSSPTARFALVGMTVRLDRRDFAAEAEREATCGEVRLIYRLAYRFTRDGRAYASRMPFSVNVVHDLPKPASGSCADVARALVVPANLNGAAARAGWLATGPLAAASPRPKQIEINAQIVRFPSGQEVAFGGQAAYLMRVFGVAPGEGPVTLFDKALENTPDVARLRDDEALRADLADFLKERSGAVEQGVVRVPDRFLATRVISYSTFGSARYANRPYAQVFGKNGVAFAGMDFGRGGLVRSVRGFIERLDGMTCQGCHQSGATAGFHIIGEDDPSTSQLNRVLVGYSPHFNAERPRRAAYAASIAVDREPNRLRPLPVAPPADWSGDMPRYAQATLGQACLPEAARREIGEGWTCGGGATCTVIAENPSLGVEYGQCMRNERMQEYSGQACLSGRIEPSSGPRPWIDRFTVLARLNAHAPRINARDHTCRPPVGGTPGGLAYRQCDESDRRFASFQPGQAPPNEICGFAGGKAFDLCVATNDFSRCLGGAIVRGMRATCSADRMCREDFMCQALPTDIAHVGRVAGLGYCSPTYFLFQMRLDGHPDPRRRS